MKIFSTAFEDNQSIPVQYTCDGTGSNPALKFSDVPAEAKSLVLIMEDPDVPESIRPDGMWDHWLAFNIPPDTREIPAGGPTPGTPGTGTSGDAAYHGPCPPDGEHRYVFKLFALDTNLELVPGASKAEILQAMEGHVIEQAELTGRYERQSR